MKRVLFFLFIFICYNSFGQIKLSQLPSATGLNSSDLFLLSQGSTSTKLTYDFLKYKIFNIVPYALRLNYSSDSLRVDLIADSANFKTNNRFFTFNKPIKVGNDTLADKPWVKNWVSNHSSLQIYPGTGIPLSTGSSWGTSIIDNSSNWNTAYSWGNHASAGYVNFNDTTNGSGNKKIQSTYRTDYLANFKAPIKYDNDTIFYLPNQTNFQGSLFILGGGQNLSHSSGVQGYRNISIGKLSGLKLTTAANNVMIGGNNLVNTTTASSNFALGYEALKYLTTGGNNVGIGVRALDSLTTGTLNTAIGGSAGLYWKGSASNNIFIGNQSGLGNPGTALISNYGSNNVFIGNLSGRYGNYNNCTIIGTNSGQGIINKGINQTGQIKIGYEAGQSDTLNNKLYIENSSSLTPLIGGDFSTDKIGINKSMTSTWNQTLNIGGNTEANIYYMASISDTTSSTDLQLMPRRWILDRLGSSLTASKGVTRNVNNFEIASSSAMNNFTWYRSTFLGSNIDFAVQNLLLQSSGSRGGVAYVNILAGNTSYKPSIEINTTGSTTGTGDDFSIDIDSSGISLKNDGNEVAKIDSSGHVYHVGTFAGIKVTDASTAQSIPTGTTYTKLTGFTNNGESSNCTADAANDKITIIKTGRYLVTWNLTGSIGTANVMFTITAFLGGTEVDPTHAGNKFTVANDVDCLTGTGIVNVSSVPVDLDLRAHHDNGGSVNITPIFMNMNINYLGE